MRALCDSIIAQSIKEAMVFQWPRNIGHQWMIDSVWDSEPWESTFCVFTCLPEPWVVCSADKEKHTQPSAPLWPHAFMDLIVCGVLHPHPDVQSDHRPYVDGWEKTALFSEGEQDDFPSTFSCLSCCFCTSIYEILYKCIETPSLMLCCFHTFASNSNFLSSSVHVLPVSFAKRVELCCLPLNFINNNVSSLPVALEYKCRCCTRKKKR